MSDQPLFPEFSKEDLDRAFDEALQAAERLHRKLASAAEGAGYVKSTLLSLGPVLGRLYDKAQEDPTLYPIVASGITFLRGLGPELDRLAGVVGDMTAPFNLAVNSTGTFAYTSDSASMIWGVPGLVPQDMPAPPHRMSREHYSEKLNLLHPSLARTYEQVWQTCLGTSSDPYRAALFTMRTLFDNFFAHLAPDDDVRVSTHWRPKEGEKPNQIWRSERLAYALQKNILDPERRAILEAESTQINALYEAANAAHNRGELDEGKASKALNAMDGFLRDWIDSLP